MKKYKYTYYLDTGQEYHSQFFETPLDLILNLFLEDDMLYKMYSSFLIFDEKNNFIADVFDFLNEYFLGGSSKFIFLLKSIKSIDVMSILNNKNYFM